LSRLHCLEHNPAALLAWRALPLARRLQPRLGVCAVSACTPLKPPSASACWRRCEQRACGSHDPQRVCCGHECGVLRGAARLLFGPVAAPRHASGQLCIVCTFGRWAVHGGGLQPAAWVCAATTMAAATPVVVLCCCCLDCVCMGERTLSCGIVVVVLARRAPCQACCVLPCVGASRGGCVSEKKRRCASVVTVEAVGARVARQQS
jgi:hypothetical protein